MASASPLPQAIEESNVQKKNLPGRGNGLFAASDLHVRSKVIFVARPLLMVLDTAELKARCDYCLKSPSDSITPESADIAMLKRCTGCNILRFCDRQCQRHAWSHYHKFECKVYAAQPRALPTLNRGVLRLLKQHEAGVLPSGEWDDLHALEDHYEKTMQGGGKKWQDLLLVSKKLQKDSGNKRSLETIMRLVCLVVVNSFTLTSPTFDPIGLVFHPKSALFNHSCEPNAFVRFDISPKSEGGRFPPYGSISVHTLRSVSKDEELTISYIDTTNPRGKRRQELKERYFFDCSCSLCSQGSIPVLDGYGLGDVPADQERPQLDQELSKVQTSASQYLERIKASPGMEHEHIAGIKDAMRQLSDTHSWGLHQYPWPQLRKVLFLGLLNLGELDAAFLHCAILLTKVYPLTITEKHHPVRLVEMWTLFMMSHNLLATRANDGNGTDIEPLATLGCAALHELHELLSIGDRTEGQFERMVNEALRSVQSQPHVWANYEVRVRNSRAAWAWLKQKTDEYLVKEEGVQAKVLGDL